MNEEEKRIEEQKGFIQLVKELAETQTILAKVNAQLAIREGQDQIKETIDETRKNLEEKAKAFGVSLKQMEEQYKTSREDKKGIMDKYKEVLEEMNQEYDKAFLDIMESISKLQTEEQAVMLEQKENKTKIKDAETDFDKSSKKLKEEAISATKDGNLELAKQKIDELSELNKNHEVNKLKENDEKLQTQREEIRKLIEESEAEFEKIKAEKEEQINNLTQHKDTQLAMVPKQNIFQKMIAVMFSKFNGSKKFMKSAMEPLNAKIETLEKEELPKIKKAVEEKRKEFAQKIQDGEKKMVEVINEKVEQFRGKKSQLKEQIEELRKNAIDKAISMGESVQDAEKRFKEAVVDKAETVAFYGMEAKDKVVDTTNKIVNGIKDKGKRTYRDIIQKGNNAKLGIINSIQRNLNEKQKELEEKMKKISEQESEKETEGRE